MKTKINKMKSREVPKQYQERKLIVENLEIGKNKELFESELGAFLGRYGVIIDLVVMKNSGLIRKTQVLRSGELPGRPVR